MPDIFFKLFALPFIEWALRQGALWLRRRIEDEEKAAQLKKLHDDLENAKAPQEKADAAKAVLSFMRANWKSS